jgi:hypothetical protein
MKPPSWATVLYTVSFYDNTVITVSQERIIRAYTRLCQRIATYAIVHVRPCQKLTLDSASIDEVLIYSYFAAKFSWIFKKHKLRYKAN